MAWLLRPSHPLRRQKPRRKKSMRRGGGIRWLRRLAVAMVLACVGFFVYLRFEPEILPQLLRLWPPSMFLWADYKQERHPAQMPRKQWRISVEGDHSTPPPEGWKEQITATLSERLREGRRDELAHLARLLLSQSMFDQVQLTRIATEHVLVRVRVPRAVALVKADVLRLLSPHAHIFGVAQAEDHPQLPMVTGIFAHAPSRFPLTGNNKLVLPPATQDVLGEVLKALKLLDTQQLAPENLHHDTYRGIHIRLKTGTLVALGHPPYAKKIQRLKAILQQASEHGESLKKIELDFKGKAFVQASGDPSSVPGRF